MDCLCKKAAGDAACGACPSGYDRANVTDQFSACVNTDGCALEPCYAGVLCTDVPPPGVGRTCGACPAGYKGDGGARLITHHVLRTAPSLVLFYAAVHHQYEKKT